MLEFLRPYAPELAGWFRDFGQGAANYDANGHYARIQPIFNAFTFTDNPAGGVLTPIPPSQRFDGLRDQPAAPLPGRRVAARRRRLGAVARRRAARSTAIPTRCRPGHESRASPSPPSCSSPRSRRSFVVTRDEDDAYRVRAIFDNAGFVIPGEDVKVAGVKVGSIEDVEVTPDFKAAVVLRIDDPGYQDFRADAQLHRAAAVADRRAVRRVRADADARRRRRAARRSCAQIEDGPGRGPVPAAGREHVERRSTST